MEDIPPYIGLVFAATTLATYGFVVFSVKEGHHKKSRFIPSIYAASLLTWLIATALLAKAMFFDDVDFKPPKIFLFVAAYVIAGLLPFLSKAGRGFLQRIPITSITYLHIIRVPVEIVLWWLFLEGKVPQQMTFEGMNYDIISGITAPFAALFLVGKKIHHRLGAIIWNVLALALLINIVTRAILATPFFYDPAVFETPNIAVLYPPFVWLPCFVAPTVLLAHIIALYQLVMKSKD